MPKLVQTASVAPWTPARRALMAAVVSLAGWAGWQAWQVNLTLSCWMSEWPYLSICSQINGRTPEEMIIRLEERLRSNPGDHVALVSLAVQAQQPGAAAHLDAPSLLAAALRAAPQHGELLRLRAEKAMAEQRWVDALDPLSRLARYHQDPSATQALAELVGYSSEDPALSEALLELARIDGAWLRPVVSALPRAKVPPLLALPLLEVLFQQDKLDTALGFELMRQLKAAENWPEAYALWIALWKQPLPLLFNGDFEDPFIQGGFDWEAPNANAPRAGASVSRGAASDRRNVLRVELLDRQVGLPIVRQHLVLPPGRFQFSGEYQSGDLRSDQGLAWVFSCASGEKKEFARTPALQTTQRAWKKWSFELAVPETCALGVELALQPQAAYEAKTGMRGEILFDHFVLTVIEVAQLVDDSRALR